MKEFLKQRPWVWIVLLLGLGVAINVLLLVVAQRSHGPDLLRPAAAAVQQAGKPAALP